MDEQSDRAKLAEITHRNSRTPTDAVDLGGRRVGILVNSGTIDADGDVVGQDKIGGDSIRTDLTSNAQSQVTVNVETTSQPRSYDLSRHKKPKEVDTVVKIESVDTELLWSYFE